MSYSKSLRKRLFPPRPDRGRHLTPRQAVEEAHRRFPKVMEALHNSEQQEALPVPPHPQKYPDHPGIKGALFNGVCNRTACGRGNATWFNIGTRGYYCRECADGINWKPGTILCIEVDHNLTHEEMDRWYSMQSRKGW